MMHEAMLYDKLKDDKVKCYLCAHKCKVSIGKFGVCGVRQNINGEFYTHVYGEAIASHVDPIEKKPLYHFLPGSASYSIATIGCNFKCGFCQNWHISQKPQAKGAQHPENMDLVLGQRRYPMAPEDVVKNAKANKCETIAYTYTEPTIFFEYAYDTAKLAKQNGIANVFVTNGFMTRDAVEKIKPYLNAANVDLKSFSDEFYKKTCHGRLQPVLDSIKLMKKLGIWVEVTTLIVPGKNDSDDELEQIAEFISKVGREVPWHISRFHPDYKYTKLPPTPIKTLRKAQDIGKNVGLRYIYLGNVHEGLDTFCHHCTELLIRREYMGVEENFMKNAECPKCGTPVGGVFKYTRA